jgi:hypothetical protein
MIFFQFLDNILATITERLQQQTMLLYVMVEETMLSAANNAHTDADNDNISQICNHFGSDLDQRKIRLNLEMLHDLMGGSVADKLSDVTDAIIALGPARRLYDELSKLLKSSAAS